MPRTVGQLERLRQEANETGLTFPLAFHTDDGRRELEVFLLRHQDPGDADAFTVHDAATGQWLAYGDTKAEAETAASIALHQHHDLGIPLPPVPKW